jgi:hypothetical protein
LTLGVVGLGETFGFGERAGFGVWAKLVEEPMGSPRVVSPTAIAPPKTIMGIACFNQDRVIKVTPKLGQKSFLKNFYCSMILRHLEPALRSLMEFINFSNNYWVLL